MAADRAGWPSWARNTFIAQLVINFALLVLLATMHLLGQQRDHAARQAMEVRLAAAEKEIESVDAVKDELRDWWAIDSRNLKKEIDERFTEHERTHHD